MKLYIMILYVKVAVYSVFSFLCVYCPFLLYWFVETIRSSKVNTQHKRNKPHLCHNERIEEYSAIKGLSPFWFISKIMAKQDFVYHCWQWPAVTLKWLLHMLWISHHYETFTECRNEDSVAEIDTNSIFMICGLDPLLALYSSIILERFTKASGN